MSGATPAKVITMLLHSAISAQFPSSPRFKENTIRHPNLSLPADLVSRFVLLLPGHHNPLASNCPHIPACAAPTRGRPGMPQRAQARGTRMPIAYAPALAPTRLRARSGADAVQRQAASTHSEPARRQGIRKRHGDSRPWDGCASSIALPLPHVSPMPRARLFIRQQYPSHLPPSPDLLLFHEGSALHRAQRHL